ncbi:hypothetical protein ILYODFUR_016406 [Ilyodon furcidens]|uniref:Secreted protein n=1 Tax=Ilyodon furcidens TaxID=33524 RepID=A0ABV0SNV8_9TELE
MLAALTLQANTMALMFDSSLKRPVKLLYLQQRSSKYTSRMTQANAIRSNISFTVSPMLEFSRSELRCGDALPSKRATLRSLVFSKLFIRNIHTQHGTHQANKYRKRRLKEINKKDST